METTARARGLSITALAFSILVPVIALIGTFWADSFTDTTAAISFTIFSSVATLLLIGIALALDIAALVLASPKTLAVIGLVILGVTLIVLIFYITPGPWHGY